MNTGARSSGSPTNRIASRRSILARAAALLVSSAVPLLALITSTAPAAAQTTPSFAAPAAYNMQPGTTPVSAITGIFNSATGLLDFAVLEHNAASNFYQIEIFHARGDGSFCTNCAAASPNPDLITFAPAVTINAIAAGQFRSSAVDIAVATNSGISFLQNNGAGTFALSSTTLPSAGGVASLVVGFFNGDANLDIAASSNATPSSFTVFFGDGTGAFPNHTGPYLVGSAYSSCPNIMQIGFQGQTTQNDIAIMCSQSTSVNVLVYLNSLDGEGNFTAGPTPYSGNAFSGNPGVAVGTINGQGAIFAAPTTSTFKSYESNGQAGSSNDFSAVNLIPVGLAPSGGGPLVVLYDQPTTAIDFVYPGNGTTLSTFTAYTQSGSALNGTWNTSQPLAPVGVETAGYSPNLDAGPIYLVINPSDHIGFYSNYEPYVDERSIDVSLITLNADGTVATTNSAPIYSGAGAHGYSFPPSFATGDFNGDGKLDLAVTGADGATGDADITIYLANPDGSIPTTTSVAVTQVANTDYAGADAIVSGTFRTPQSGKQLSDLAIFSSNQIFFLPSNGDGTFATPTAFPLGEDPDYPGFFYNPSAGSFFVPVLLATDVNGDGIEDLVLTLPEANCSTSGASQGAVYILISKGDGTFQPPVSIPPPVVNPVSVTAAKFFNGAVSDLVLADGGDKCSPNPATTDLTAVGILQNKVPAGATTITASEFIPYPVLPQASDLSIPNVSAVSSADFNADGKPDLVVSNTQGIEVLLNQGAGTFTPTTQGLLPLYTGDVVPGPACNASGGYVDCITYDAQAATGSFFVPGENDIAVSVDGVAYVFRNQDTGVLTPPTQGFVAGLSSAMLSSALTGSSGLSSLLVATPQGAAYLSNTTTPTTPQPIASFSSSSLAFGPQTIETTSAVQTITLTNTGTANLTVSSVSLDGTNASDFAKIDHCTAATVTPSNTCTVSLTFTPSAIGSRNASLSFSDNAPASPQAVALTGTGACQAITVSPDTLAPGTSGTLYPSVTFTETGGIGTTTLTESGALPTGITFTTPTLSGTPTETGSFPFRVTATDSNSCTGIVNNTLLINSTSTGPAVVNDSETITVTDIETFPDAADSETITVTDTETVVAYNPIAITPTPAVFNSSRGTAYQTAPYPPETFTATGGLGELTVTETGALPAGVTFLNGVLSGTPVASSAGKSYSFSITASDANNDQTTVAGYTLTVSTETLPPAAVNDSETITVTDTETFPDIYDAETITIADTATVVAYTPITISPTPASFNAVDSIANATDPYAPVQFAAAGGVGALTLAETGTLPPGMTFTGGALSGTPATSAIGNTYSFSITATDADGDQASVQSYALTVDMPIPPTLTLIATPPSVTIVRGETGTTMITLTPAGGYTGTVTLSCLSLPYDAHCVFTQAGVTITSVTFDGSNDPATVTLAIQTDVPMDSRLTPTTSSANRILQAVVLWWPAYLLGVAAFGRKDKIHRKLRRQTLPYLVVLATIAIGLAGCAGGAEKHLTPVGKSTIVVSAQPTRGSSETVDIQVNITE
jgi:FG-GAP-like repeat/FG-GAP repeat